MPDVDQKLTNVNPDKLLKDMTEGYAPTAYISNVHLISRNRPPFNRTMIREMLSDPRIIYGLWLLKGPLLSKGPRRKESSKSSSPSPFQMAFPPEKNDEGKPLFSGGNKDGKPFPPKGPQPFGNVPKSSGSEVQGFTVQCERDDVKKFIEDQYVRFWRTEAIKALKSLEWGFSGSEVCYRVKDGYMHFDRLKDFYAEDTSPVRYRGKLVGMNVRITNYTQTPDNKAQAYLGGPKALWHVHWRDRNAWWGVSRLFGAHIPWWEKWCDGGYRDIRRLWFYKNAYNGGVLYHPPGSSRTDTGQVISNKDLAREIIEKMRTGGVLALPNTPAGDGAGKAWEYESPVGNEGPQGILEYGESLDTETLESLGIPPEIIESSGNQGFGSSTGRQIPQEAFESILQELIMWLMYDFDQQVIRYLVAINYENGDEIDYEVIPTPIGEQGGTSIASPQPDDYHGNQWQEQDGKAKDQNQIDEEKMDRAPPAPEI